MKKAIVLLALLASGCVEQKMVSTRTEEVTAVVDRTYDETFSPAGALGGGLLFSGKSGFSVGGAAMGGMVMADGCRVYFQWFSLRAPSSYCRELKAGETVVLWREVQTWAETEDGKELRRFERHYYGWPRK